MLTNTLSRSGKLQTQTGTTSSEFGNLFTTVLNQLLIEQEDLQSLNQQMPSTYSPNREIGNNPMTLNAMNLINGNMPININQPLRFQPITADKINQELEGKLKGMGEVFVRAGQQYNIDSALLTAIAQHETGNGKSRAANEKNNIAGMMGANGLKSYSSVEDSIMDMARNLNKNYLGSGLSSISKIAEKYAPIGAGNDPNGLNNHWVSGVTKYFNQLKV
jgi:beta-N-acetylglucosaminidase